MRFFPDTKQKYRRACLVGAAVARVDRADACDPVDSSFGPMAIVGIRWTHALTRRLNAPYLRCRMSNAITTPRPSGKYVSLGATARRPRGIAGPNRSLFGLLDSAFYISGGRRRYYGVRSILLRQGWGWLGLGSLPFLTPRPKYPPHVSYRLAV